VFSISKIQVVDFLNRNSKKIIFSSTAVALILVVALGGFLWQYSRPVAVVNGEEITRSEYNRSYEINKKMLAFMQDESTDTAVKTKEELIEKNLVEIAAKENSLSVSDEEVEAEIDEKLQSKEQSGDKEEFYATYREAYGYTEEEIFEQIKYNLLRDKVEDKVLNYKSGKFIYSSFVDSSTGSQISGFDTLDAADTWANSEMEKYKAMLDAGKTFEEIYDIINETKPNFISAGPFKNVNKNSSDYDSEGLGAILSLNVGENSPIISSDGFYIIYHVDTVAGGYYNTWDEFINDYKNKYVEYSFLSAKQISSIGQKYNKLAGFINDKLGTDIALADNCANCGYCTGGVVYLNVKDNLGNYVGNATVTASSNSQFCNGDASSSKAGYCGYNSGTSYSASNAKYNGAYNVQMGGSGSNNCFVNCANGRVTWTFTASAQNYTTLNSISTSSVTNYAPNYLGEIILKPIVQATVTCPNFTINYGATCTSTYGVILAGFSGSGGSSMIIWNGGDPEPTAWRSIPSTMSWSVNGASTSTVYARFKNSAGAITGYCESSIKYPCPTATTPTTATTTTTKPPTGGSGTYYWCNTGIGCESSNFSSQTACNNQHKVCYKDLNSCKTNCPVSGVPAYHCVKTSETSVGCQQTNHTFSDPKFCSEQMGYECYGTASCDTKCVLPTCSTVSSSPIMVRWGYNTYIHIDNANTRGADYNSDSKLASVLEVTSSSGASDETYTDGRTGSMNTNLRNGTFEIGGIKEDLHIVFEPRNPYIGIRGSACTLDIKVIPDPPVTTLDWPIASNIQIIPRDDVNNYGLGLKYHVNTSSFYRIDKKKNARTIVQVYSPTGSLLAVPDNNVWGSWRTTMFSNNNFVFSIPSGLNLPEGTYTWRANAEDETHLFSGWASNGTFCIGSCASTSVNKPPTVKLISPIGKSFTQAEAANGIDLVASGTDPDTHKVAIDIQYGPSGGSATDLGWSSYVADNVSVSKKTAPLTPGTYVWRANAYDNSLYSGWVEGIFVVTSPGTVNCPALSINNGASCTNSYGVTLSGLPTSGGLQMIIWNAGDASDSTNWFSVPTSGTLNWNINGAATSTIQTRFKNSAGAMSGYCPVAIKYPCPTTPTTTPANHPPSVKLISPIGASYSQAQIGSGISLSASGTDSDTHKVSMDIQYYNSSGSLMADSGWSGYVADNVSVSLRTAVLTPGTYTWRANAYDGSLYSGWETGYFTVTAATTPANHPPTAKLISPVSGASFTQAQVGSGINLIASGTDPDSHQVYMDIQYYHPLGFLIDDSGWSGYVADNVAVSLKTTALTPGTYTWRANAYDGSLYSGWVTGYFTVTATATTTTTTTTAINHPPTVKLISPVSGASFTQAQVGSGINLIASGTDPDTHIVTIDIQYKLAGGSQTDLGWSTVADNVSVSLKTTALTPGTYVWRANAYDGYLYSGWVESYFTVTAATTPVTTPAINHPPTVKLISPANGASFTEADVVSGINLSASGTDPDTHQVYMDIQFYNSAGNLAASLSGPGYVADNVVVSLKTAALTLGNYTWRARTYDNSGFNSGWTVSNFTVNANDRPPLFGCSATPLKESSPASIKAIIELKDRGSGSLKMTGNLTYTLDFGVKKISSGAVSDTSFTAFANFFIANSYQVTYSVVDEDGTTINSNCGQAVSVIYPANYDGGEVSP
jgi:hypothetical protein